MASAKTLYRSGNVVKVFDRNIWLKKASKITGDNTDERDEALIKLAEEMIQEYGPEIIERIGQNNMWMAQEQYSKKWNPVYTLICAAFMLQSLAKQKAPTQAKR